MGSVVRVDDAHDPRLSDYIGLTDIALRQRLEPAGGLFIAEGEKVVRRALSAGYEPRSLLISSRWLDSLADSIASFDAPILLAPEATVEQITGYAVHRGALAAMSRRPLPSLAHVLDGARQVVVLEDVNDHTNLGAVFRSAAALGMDAVVLSPRCVDPLYRRAVKVSMGAVFTLPYARMLRWPDDYDEIRSAGLELLALTPSADAVSLPDVPRKTLDRCALMIGSEGSGLSERALAMAQLQVRIPMSYGIDSLNVAAAAAIACYALRWGR